MPKRLINFNLDIAKKDNFTKFEIKQLDNATINIKLLENGLPYNVSNSTVKLYAGVNNEMFLQEENITANENSVVINLDKNILTEKCTAYGELEITDSTGTVTSTTFIFKIVDKVGEGANIPGNIEGFVAKYEKLIQEFKNQVNNAVAGVDEVLSEAINNVEADYNSLKRIIINENQAADLQDQINETNTQLETMANKGTGTISILEYKQFAIGDDWTIPFQKAIDDSEAKNKTIFVPSKDTPYRIGALYIKERLSLKGENVFWGNKIHHSSPGNDSVIQTTKPTFINAKSGYENTPKYIGITNMSFDNEYQGSETTIFFNDLKLSSSYICNNRIRSYHIVLYGEMNELSLFDRNLILNIRKNFITYDTVNLTDSRITNNYINGSTTVNDATAFNLINPNQSIISGNFIDYFNTAIKIPSSSIGLDINSNDIQLCGTCFDFDGIKGVTVKGNRIRWIKSTYKTYWTDKGVDVSNFGSNGKWLVFKNGYIISLLACDNFISLSDVVYLFTNQSINDFKSTNNLYSDNPTYISNDISYLDFSKPYGVNVTIDESKFVEHVTQPVIVTDRDRSKYLKGYKFIKNDVEYTNFDNSILFKNALGKYCVGNDIIYNYSLDNTYDFTTILNGDITIEVPNEHATRYVWVYTNIIPIKANTNYLVNKEVVQGTIYNAIIQAKIDGEWVEVGRKTGFNNYEYIVNINSTELRFAINCERGFVTKFKKPSIFEIL